MKKLLLATSALVGLASTAALAGGGHAPAAATPTSANAGALNVMVGGFINVEHSIADQDNNAGNQGITSTNTAGTTRDTSFTNDAEIHITVAGSAEDFDYGGVIELNAQIDSSDAESGDNADRVYIFAENDGFGRVEFGGNAGASQTLEIDASNIARATGGVEGNWWHYVDVDGISTTSGTNVTAETFILQPNLVAAELDQRGSDRSKITYYTPRFSGVQLGVSYTNDTGDLGSANSLSGRQNSGNFENVFGGGINFEQNFDGLEVGLAAVGETGEAESSTLNDLSAYSLGGKVGMSGFSVAGNYADLGDSGLSTTATNDEQTLWTAGAAYENGPYGVSVTYLNSERPNATTATNNNELSNVVVGADYQLAPGLTPYVEAAFFELDDGHTTARNDNDGSVVLLGAELSF